MVGRVREPTDEEVQIELNVQSANKKDMID